MSLIVKNDLETVGFEDCRLVALPLNRLGFAEIRNEVVFYVGLNVKRVEEFGFPIDWETIKERLIHNEGNMIWLKIIEGNIVPE